MVMSNLDTMEPVDRPFYSYQNTAGDKNYELSNQLGNVMSVVRDRKLALLGNTNGIVESFVPDVVQYSDYYPFGMLMPGRHGSESDYLYGFNGKEKDDEVKGEANSIDFGARMYDPRIGRWLTLDPKMKNYPSESHYSAFRNSPILYVDLDGNEWVNAHTAKVKELESQALDNPNNKGLQRSLDRERNKEAKVAQYLNTLQENDVSLYNYVDQLQVENRNGEKINVKVNVSVKSYNANKKESAKTSYENKGEAVKYNSLEGGGGFLAPLNNDGDIGFDIEINGEFSYQDGPLSNEAVDVMFRMEYPAAARKSVSDKGKSEEEYLKPGTAADYSNRVQEIYIERKETGEGKDKKNNPYPLKNE
jgi:RHS repeat-associated protein